MQIESTTPCGARAAARIAGYLLGAGEPEYVGDYERLARRLARLATP